MTQPKKPPSPEGVPTAYIMQPFEVKLTYNGKSWMTLPLEVGHNEVGDANDPDMVSSPEAATDLPTADEAVEWANALVAKIDAAE